ncbi:MAG: hypothetical protein H0U65_15365 [Rubrobacter sp.]|nr:hypothetical protein [Rubrobacter sp.]
MRVALSSLRRPRGFTPPRGRDGQEPPSRPSFHAGWPPEHFRRDGRGEERARRREHAKDFEEGVAHAEVAQREFENRVHVPMDEPGRGRRRPALDSAHPEVLSGGERPRRGVDFGELFLETVRETDEVAVPAFAQTFLHCLGSEGGGGHSLSVYGIE